MFYIINSADYDGRHIDITSVLLESNKTSKEKFDIGVAISKAVNEYVRSSLTENRSALLWKQRTASVIPLKPYMICKERAVLKCRPRPTDGKSRKGNATAK